MKWNVELMSTDSPVDTSASESMWHNHFECLSDHPVHGCRIYHTGWCALLAHWPEATAAWILLTEWIWHVTNLTQILYYSLPSFPTVCRISRSRRHVSRKQLKILCSTDGIPTLCIWSKYTTTSLYNSTSRWNAGGSNVDHQFPDAHRNRGAVAKTVRQKKTVQNCKNQKMHSSSYPALSVELLSGWWAIWQTG